MHELSLAEGAIALIEETARREGFTKVHAIRMEIGALSCVEPEALRLALEAAGTGSCADGAALEIVTVDAEGECPACGGRIPMTEAWALCPRCGGHALRVTRGDAMRIVDLEVE